MSQGLQIWDSGGTLIVDTSTFTCRLLAIINTNAANGSATVPALATIGTPFGLFNAFYTGTENGQNPNITISGTTVSWYYDLSGYGTNPVFPINGTIFVGIK